MSEAVLKDNPPVRADGACAQCGRSRMTWRSQTYAGRAAERDPFCDTKCARAWHGCPLDDERADRRGKCVDCGKPHHWARNTNAGERCRKCERVFREKRHFDDPNVCAHCGCDLDAKTAGCRRCIERHRRRERTANPAVRARINEQIRTRRREVRAQQKSEAVAAPRLVESSPHRDSEAGALSGAPGAATNPDTSTRKAA